MRKTKSPLKDKPLRNPGQSIDEQLRDLFDDRLLAPLMIALFLLLLAGMEWWRYYKPVKPAPFVFTAIAVLAVVFAAYRIATVWPRAKQLRLGRDGERAVGQFLERLRANGYEVFHDVVGNGFNVDHVLIGPAGIFTVETKTISKPAEGDATILFDGDTLRVAGFVPDRDPVVQAKAQASWLRAVVSESTGKKLPVRSVVLYPGWFVRSAGPNPGVWVLEPKALPAFLESEEETLSAADIKLVTFHLSRFIRTSK